MRALRKSVLILCIDPIGRWRDKLLAACWPGTVAQLSFYRWQGAASSCEIHHQKYCWEHKRAHIGSSSFPHLPRQPMKAALADELRELSCSTSFSFNLSLLVSPRTHNLPRRTAHLLSCVLNQTILQLSRAGHTSESPARRGLYAPRRVDPPRGGARRTSSLLLHLQTR